MIRANTRTVRRLFSALCAFVLAATVVAGVGASGGSNDSDGSGVAELAKQIRAKSDVITFTTDAAREAIALTAKGKKVPVPEKGTKVYLSKKLLKLILDLSEKYSIGIGYITNGKHSDESRHYVGSAIDVNSINGHKATGKSKLDRRFAQTAVNFIPKGGGIGIGCVKGLDVPEGVRYFSEPCDHIHLDVPRPE